jgi:hypothetical protein
MANLEWIPPGPQLLAPDPNRVPGLFRDAGEHAAQRFIELFTANIRNRNTRLAYARAAAQFATWCDLHLLQLALPQIGPFHVAAYLMSFDHQNR